jgi:hypothetical protein
MKHGKNSPNGFEEDYVIYEHLPIQIRPMVPTDSNVSSLELVLLV